MNQYSWPWYSSVEDALFLGFGKSTLGENEFSKRHFNLMQIISADRSSYNIYIPNMKYPRLATGWTVRGSNPGAGDIFRTRPDRPWGLPGLLYNGYRVFPGGKAAGAWC